MRISRRNGCRHGAATRSGLRGGKVHIAAGPWVTDNGDEYKLVVIAAMAAITEVGPGRPPVDSVHFPDLEGTAWSAAVLAAAVAGSAARHLLAPRRTRRECGRPLPRRTAHPPP